MKTEKLIFPDGIRLLPDAVREWGIPAQELSEEEISRRDKVDIRTGYKLHQAGENQTFTAYVEANIHAPLLWQAFSTLVSRLLPAHAFPIVVYDQGQPWHGPITLTKSILELAAEFQASIQHDGFIGFGIIAYPEGKLEEVYINEMKYLQIWTNQSRILVESLEGLGIPRADETQFIDQYPRMTKADFGLESTAPSSWAVAESLIARLRG